MEWSMSPRTTEKFMIENIDLRKGPTYPFHRMDVGQSFVFSKEIRSRVAASASIYGKKTNSKFVVREYDGQYRCGRVK
jgi:hypothetical protein